MAPMPAANIAQILIERPADIFLRTGAYVKIQLKMRAFTTTMVMDFPFFMSGTTMATNIPYIARPNALISEWGRTFPSNAPISVPVDHPI